MHMQIYSTLVHAQHRKNCTKLVKLRKRHCFKIHVKFAQEMAAELSMVNVKFFAKHSSSDKVDFDGVYYMQHT